MNVSYNVLSIHNEKTAIGTKNTRKKRHLQINKRGKKAREAIGAPAHRRTNERMAAASIYGTTVDPFRLTPGNQRLVNCIIFLEPKV